MIATVMETTGKVKLAAEHENNQIRFRALFDQSPTFMALLIGPEHRYAMANPGYLKLIDGRAVEGLTIAEAPARGGGTRLCRPARRGLSHRQALYRLRRPASRRAGAGRAGPGAHPRLRLPAADQRRQRDHRHLHRRRRCNPPPPGRGSLAPAQRDAGAADR
ncbi:MAG: hypothetical protein WDN06_11060 [Asticcacaulis sp.]